MVETILQNPLFTKIVLPFALIFFILFGILEKTKTFGDNKKQLHALIAAVIGLIFVAAVSPRLIVEHLILFLTVAIIVVFIGLLLWGFISGGDAKIPDSIKPLAGAVVILAVAVALLWALGVKISFFEKVFGFLFKSSWSSSFWTNAVFIIVVIIAIVLMVRDGGKK